MALFVIATPIGHLGDITLRALEQLKKAELLIGEERKVVSRLIKDLELGQKTIDLLNEHSDNKDIEYLVEQCRRQDVALVSDCGTPGFCDPGAFLVKACRQKNISVHILPGPSSLMAFLSGCGEDIKSFFFRGFLPANNQERERELSQLSKRKESLILMDTPYRLTKILEDLKKHFPQRQILLATQLTKEDECFEKATAHHLYNKYKGQKLEFVLAVL